jgi:hypothetical protein
LIAAMNPCRCGHLDDAAQACGRAPKCAIEDQAKISGPLFDRIDLHVDVPAVRPGDLSLPRAAAGSREVAARVAAARAEQAGYFPQVILAGRRINDGMGVFIAQKLVKMLIANDITVKGAKVGVLGLTFKENVPDLRNSRVPDILGELRQFGIEPLVHDAVADGAEAHHEFGLTLYAMDALSDLDALIVAVSHREYLALGTSALASRIRPGGVLVDVKSCLVPDQMPSDRHYWSL